MTADGQRNLPPSIRANLLGRVRLWVGNRLIDEDAWSLRSARSLFLLLLITPGHAMPKERVLDILWPELGPTEARNAMYKALHLLRRVLEPDLTSARNSSYIETRGATIRLSPDVEIWVDAEACQQALHQARVPDIDERRSRLREAVALYGGELLPTDLYEDWPVARREALRHAWEGSVLDLAELDLEANAPEASVPSLELLLTTDPINEVAHRALMRGYMAGGQRDRALRQYARCVSALKDGLGVSPDEETQALYASIVEAAPDPGIAPPQPTGPFNNLPAPPSPIVGREREADILQGTLWRQDVRLVTLTGPGGVGKTRLALEVASQLCDDYADGVAFVPLAAVRDPDLVIQTISSTLGLPEEPSSTLAATLTAYLRTRDMLLVLDNFEHVLEAATDIGDLLASCPSLTVLATSRERLRLRGEYLHDVRPLALPRRERLPSPEVLARVGSIALFTQHMQRIDPDFQVTVENSAVVSAICAHLEGLPLAIELATARARFFSLDGLLARLARRLDIEEGPRDLPARQRTLRATFAWSHDLLTAGEQQTFRRLATAVGGYTLDTAADVCGDADGRLLSHLQSLAEKHLIRWEHHDDEPRVSMLETIREFALERQRSSGEETDIQLRHAIHFLNLATEAEQHLVGTDQETWLLRLETEQGNLRAALEWGLDREDESGTLTVRGAIALWRFWLRRRALSEGIGWLERARARPRSDSQLHARILLSLAHLREAQSDYDRAEALINEALPLSRRVGDRVGVAQAHNCLGEIAEDKGDFQKATTLHRQALEIYRETGHRRESAGSLNKLAIVAYYQGDYDRATALWEDSASIYRELGDTWATGVVLGNLGAVAMATGDIDRAVALHEENLSIARQLNDQGTIGRGLLNLAEALQVRGDGDQSDLLEEALELHRETNDRQCEILALILLAHSALVRGDARHAGRLYAEGLTLAHSIGDRTTIANTALLERIAALALATAQPGHAARLIGSSEALRDELGAPILPYLRPIAVHCREQLEARMDDSVLTSAISEGRTMTLAATINAALATCARAQAGSTAAHIDVQDFLHSVAPHISQH